MTRMIKVRATTACLPGRSWVSASAIMFHGFGQRNARLYCERPHYFGIVECELYKSRYGSRWHRFATLPFRKRLFSATEYKSSVFLRELVLFTQR